MSRDYKSGSGVFKPPTIELSVDKVLRIAGYKDLDRVRPKARALAESIVELAQKSFLPSVHYRRIYVTSLDAESLRLADGTVFRCPAFEKYLDGSTEVVVAVMTLGQRFDDASHDLAGEDKVVEALFLESAGWQGIQETTRAFDRHLQDVEVEEGLEVTRRLSPGYSFRVGDEKCLWQLEDQKRLFKLFAADNLPVTLLQSCAMVPKMSRSGLYGLRPPASDDPSGA